MIDALEMMIFWMLVAALAFVALIFIACLIHAYDHQNDGRTYYFEKPGDIDKEALKVLPMIKMSRKQYKELLSVHRKPRYVQWW